MKTCPVCDTDYPDDKHATCPTDGAVLIESHELTPGNLVRGKYRILRKLGQGGMGIVYLAEDILLGVNVALKFLAGDLGKDPKFIKRFRTEARAAYQLRHPNIVEVTNLDQAEDGNLFIAMEFVQGPSLRAALEEAHGPLGIPRALDIARDITCGLAAAHAHGTVHRDIKPENILLAHAGGRERPKILDFGLVAVAESVSRVSLTRGLLLTPNYAAPEQWMEMPAIEMDGRTDLYALGCVLYEMLTGGTPFHAHHISGWMKQHMEETPRPPSHFHAEITNWPGLDGLTLQLLAKDRSHRPRDAAETLELLQAVRYDPGRQGEIATEALWGRPKTGAETVGFPPNPVAEPTLAGPSVPIAISGPVARASQQQNSDTKTESGGFPRWGWTAFALLALIAVLAAWRLAAPHWHRQQAQAPLLEASSPSQPGNQEAEQNAKQVSNPGPSDQSLPGADRLKPSPAEIGKPQGQMPEASAKPNPVPENSIAPAGTPEQPKSAQAQNSQPSDLKPEIAEQPTATPVATPTPTASKPPVIVPPTTPDVRPPDIQPPLKSVNPAELVQQAEVFDKQKRYAEAAPLYDQACTGGSAAACRQLARMYTLGNGVTKDDPRAVALYTKACNEGNVEGCLNLGVRYMNGQGVAKDDSQAAVLFAKACDAGNADGCNNLGTMNEHGAGVAKDISRAVGFYSKACDAGSAIGCGNLAKMYVRAYGNTMDVPRALALISKGCDAGNPDSCNSLGTIYENGYHVPKDTSKALTFFSKACDGGNAPGCANLGNYYRLGIGGSSDPGKAAQYLGKACGMGFQPGCIDLKQIR